MSPFLRTCENELAGGESPASELPALADTNEDGKASSTEDPAPTTEIVDVESQEQAMQLARQNARSFESPEMAPKEAAPNSEAAASGEAPRFFTKTEVTPDTGSEEIRAQMESTQFVLCVKCTYPVRDMLKCRVWGKKRGTETATFCCRVCNNAMSLVSKKLDAEEMALEGLDITNLPDQDSKTFFQKVATCVDAEGNLRWADVKRLLLDMFTNQKMKSVDVVSFSEEELPLSVWKTRGFDIDQIVEGGKRSSHPVSKEVWSVPLKTTTHDEVIFSVC